MKRSRDSVASVWRRGFSGAVLVILGVTACDYDRTPKLRYGPAELDHTHLDIRQVTGDVIFDGDDLAIPTDIEIVGNHLVVLDIASDSAIHVISRETGALVRSFGREGEGPGEFKRAWSLDPVAYSDREFWVYDVSLGRLTFVDLRDEFFDSGALGDRIVNLSTDATSLGPVHTNSNTLLSVGFYTEGRLGVYDTKGTQFATVASLPAASSDVPVNVLQHAYQAKLVTNPSRTLVAAVTRHASQVEIYRADGSMVAVRNGPLVVEPHYEVRQGDRGPVMATGEDLRFGYVDGSGSTSYLFGLFSGRTREGAWGRQHMGRFVHVFNWQGVFQMALQLDSDIAAIAVDEDALVLYGVRHDPYPAIVRYSLRGLVTGDVNPPHDLAGGG